MQWQKILNSVALVCLVSVGLNAPGLAEQEAGDRDSPSQQQERDPQQQVGEQAAGEGVDFAKHIKPLLEQTCLDCHGPDDQQGKLRVDSLQSLLDGGISGPAVVPKKPEESLLYERITLPPDDFLMMPATGEPLTEEQQKLIRQWIEQGATWPADVIVGSAPAPEMDAVAGVDFFTGTIKPLLERTCLDCHGPDDQQGRLRVDSLQALLDGGISGPSVVPGKPEESLIYERITLPPDDFLMMPATGEPLTEEEQQQIRQWIEQGAIWPADVIVGSPPAPEMDDVAGVEVTEDENAAMNQVGSLGAIAMRLAQSTNWLRVDFSLTDTEVSEEHLGLLEKMPNLYELSLAGTAITDAGLARLSGATNLRRLYLQNTNITDAGLEHLAALHNLRYLNLYGTAVTDQGLKHLEGLSTLERLYLWQTKVTEEGATRLKEAVPGVDINLGN